MSGSNTTWTAIGDLIRSIVDEVFGSKPPVKGLHFSGGRFMFTFPETRATEVVLFTPAVVVDAEGTPVEPQPVLNYSFSSSDEEIVKLSQLNADNPNELTIEYVHAKKKDDGSWGIASLKATASLTLENGEAITDVTTEDVQLVPGSAAGFVPGSFGLKP